MENFTFVEYINIAIQHNLFVRYWVKKHIFTPYEQEQKFTDQSIYEDDYCEIAQFGGVYELPDGDLMISFDNNETGVLKFYKLSEIHLEIIEEDNQHM